MRNNRTLKGFMLSFLLHLFLFIFLFLSFDHLNIIPPPSSKQDKKITLNLLRFSPPAPQPKPRLKVTPLQQKSVPTPQITPEKPVIQKPEVKPEPPKPVAKKKVVEEKKSIHVAKKSKMDNNVTKVVKKEPKKEKKLAKEKPKKKIDKRKKKVVKEKPLPTTFRLPKKHSRDKLANALMGSSKNRKRSKRVSSKSSIDKMIHQLYGKEFYRFTKTQQKFIRNNLSEIYRITQNTLYMNGYPDVAVRTGQQGVNVVSFYLHPNGDISNLRLIKPMGYEALDKNTIAVIQIAYKDYPHPKTKTKIVFYVNYQLY